MLEGKDRLSTRSIHWNFIQKTVNSTQPQASGGTPATVPLPGEETRTLLLSYSQISQWVHLEQHIKDAKHFWSPSHSTEELQGTCKPRHYAHLKFLHFHDLGMVILDVTGRQEGHARKVPGSEWYLWESISMTWCTTRAVAQQNLCQYKKQCVP